MCYAPTHRAACKHLLTLQPGQRLCNAYRYNNVCSTGLIEEHIIWNNMICFRCRSADQVNPEHRRRWADVPMTEDAVDDGSEEYAALPAPVLTEYVERLVPVTRARTVTPAATTPRALTPSNAPRSRTVPARETLFTPPAQQEMGRDMPTPSGWGGKSYF